MSPPVQRTHENVFDYIFMGVRFLFETKAA